MRKNPWHRIRPRVLLRTKASRLAASSLAYFASSLCLAGGVANITDTEMALLPRYCADTHMYQIARGGGGGPSPRYAHWANLMGPGFDWLHHTCWAKIHVMRSYRSGLSAYDRNFSRKMAITEYEFTIPKLQPDFILLPEFYTDLAKVHLQLFHYNEANQAFDKARQLKPDYWPAYYHWAEHLTQSGRKDEARQLVRTGLEYSPQSKSLIDLYQRLGGNPSAITPRKAADPREPSVNPVDASPNKE